RQFGNCAHLPSSLVVLQLNAGSAYNKTSLIHDLIVDKEAHLACITETWLRLIHQLRPYLENDCLATVTHALVTSRLDFCKVLYVGLPLKTVWILQLVQNRAARLLTGTERYVHMTPVLCQLHWLPIEVRAQFKVLVMIYKALNGLGLGYLKERLYPYMPARPLRSAGEALLQERSVKEIRRRLPQCFGTGFGGCEEEGKWVKMTKDDEVVLQCTATVHKEQQKLCLAAEGFGNRLCFLESTSNSKNVPPDLSICTFVLEQSLSVRALQEMLANTEEKAEGLVDVEKWVCPSDS
ncbi:Ryanodine receptor 2, partial [Varanus komodoensis]